MSDAAPNATFARQLKRLGLDRATPPDAASWSRFLAEVEGVYGTHERERALLERSLFLSSEESERLTQELGAAAASQVAEHDALRRVATEVAACGEPEEVAQRVAEEVVAITGVKVGMVVRFDGDGVIVVGAVGPGTEAGLRFVPAPDGPLALARRRGEPVMAPATDQRGHTASWVAAPVIVDGTAWGAITVIGPAHQDQVLERLASFAHLVGLAIENAETHRRLAEQAARDPLTGLYNHRIFHESLERSLIASTREGSPLSLVIFDIDYFKHVNDNHGHRVGDAVLRELTQRLRGVVRGGDTIARIGGEEFGWILPGSASREASTAAERLRRVVNSTPFEVAGSLSVSIGICDRAEASSAEELYTFADGALYWAKEHGRDRCVVYSPSVVSSLSVREEAERQRHAQAMASVRALARAVDAKDSSTHRHSERVARNASRLAQRAGWSEEDVERLHEAGLLHDVGKIGISDDVLMKVGSLNDSELEMVRRHPELGATIAAGLLDERQLSWIRGHHERWDGSGYPDGLAATAIPRGARLLAVADALDAMLHDRSYRASMSIMDAIEEIRRERGIQFAPEAVDLLEALIEAEGIESLVEPPDRSPAAVAD